MEPLGNAWAHQQRPSPSLLVTNGGNSFGDSDSRASSEESYDPTTVMMEPMTIPKPPDSRKRKSTEPDSAFERSGYNSKRFKGARAGSRGWAVLSDASTQLPAEVWHHIFTFLPPPTLGRLLLVNKLFNNYLDPAPSVKAIRPQFPEPPTLSTVRSRRSTFLYPMLAETIWRSSRRVFMPGMPTPLRTFSELDSWRLACSKACQFCKFRSQEEATDPWHRGPGAKGVSPVFPLLMLTCGPCLAAKTVKEVDLLLSSTIPSVLLPALPAALITPEMHVVAPQTLQSGAGALKDEIAKLYSREQIEALKAEFEGVRLLGAGAAEEWFKGLESKGKSLRLDAARWEKWEIAGGLQRMRYSVAEAHNRPSISHSIISSEPAKAQTYMDDIKIKIEGGPVTSMGSIPTRTGPTEPAVSSKPNKKRTKQEAMELMQRRREDIERRAALLTPPLTPSVLAHMRSFQAAVQLTTPLDDDTWGVLADKFLGQREEAEQQERKRREQEKASTPGGKKGVNATNGKAESSAKARDPREVPDQEWDDVQGPVRAKISEYADKIIRDRWDDGDKVSKKTSPSFAAEVLLHVRARFYAEVAKEQSAAAAAQRPLTPDPPEGPWLHKLTLENMKWVFDVKVKPFTNKLRPELFICHCCSTHKYFGLEGVIQHYAAKHTNTLSLGNVVVFWRAEWPEIPPFMPDPKNPMVHNPQDHPARSKTSITAPTPVRPDLPLKPATHQPPTQAQGHPNNGQQQTLPYAATPSTYGPPTGYQPPYPPPKVPQESGHVHGQPSTRSHKDERLGFMAVIARQTFDSLSRIEKLPSSIRLCVIVHHIAKHWQNQFNEAAPLLVFEDGVAGDYSMEPLRRMNGLRCKACAGSYSVDLQHTIYSVPTLVKHFRHAHVESGPQPLDWRTEMVSLPALDVLYDLPRLLAQDGQAYEAVSDALPWAFAEPPPTATYDSRPPTYHRQGTVFHPSVHDPYGHPQNSQPPFEQERRPPSFPQDPRGPVPQPPQNGGHILDALDSQLDQHHYHQTQPPSTSRAQTRPPDYHSNDPARQEWATQPPAHYEQHRYHESLPSHPHYPQQAPQYAYRDGPQTQEGEYEVLEARDPDTGALYHIRRRVQRDPYQPHEGPAHGHPQFEDHRRAGTVAPPARTEVEDYDPRYPAGSGPPRYQ